MSKISLEQDVFCGVSDALVAFVDWLDGFGEDSYDHQTYYAGRLGRWAKSLYYRHPRLGLAAVLPMVMSEAVLPSARRFFFERQRLPIADAHFAMGFTLLGTAFGQEEYFERAEHFLEVLRQTACPGFAGWGYPFDWQTRNGLIPKGTPLITTTPYVYEAFQLQQEVRPTSKREEFLLGIAEHVFGEYEDRHFDDGSAACAYYPGDPNPGVVNASAYRAALLVQASSRFGRERWREAAHMNTRFVLRAQRLDGSWPYALDGKRDFVDHFHTCFVLKALAKIEEMAPEWGCEDAIQKGLSYYVSHLFDVDGLPKPFAVAPRMTIYRRELYDIAECVNLAVMLAGRNPQLDKDLVLCVKNLLKVWLKMDGSFRSRRLHLGWDNMPMHRWGQSQIFRSLALLRASSQPPASQTA